MKPQNIRLGVNIDHVATIRNARGSSWPNPLRAAMLAKEAGADGITAHLREDRRHIRDSDIQLLKDSIGIPLNFECAATPEMHDILLRTLPYAACIVPEKRQERTTEGGLDVVGNEEQLRAFIAPLKAAGIRVSLFISHQTAQIEASARIGASVIELHTGHYSDLHSFNQKKEVKEELHALYAGARIASSLGLEVHAGHGLTYDNITPIAAIPEVKELNIGHFLISEAIFVGLSSAIGKMRRLIQEARHETF